MPINKPFPMFEAVFTDPGLEKRSGSDVIAAKGIYRSVVELYELEPPEDQERMIEGILNPETGDEELEVVIRETITGAMKILEEASQTHGAIRVLTGLRVDQVDSEVVVQIVMKAVKRAAIYMIEE